MSCCRSSAALQAVPVVILHPYLMLLPDMALYVLVKDLVLAVLGKRGDKAAAAERRMNGQPSFNGKSATSVPASDSG